SHLFTADDTSEVQQKCRFGLRKPLFYPLNYGNRNICRKNKRIEWRWARYLAVRQRSLKGDLCSRLSVIESRSYCARSRCANTDMAAEVKKEIELEIAHVLFTDIVGYSKLPIHQQRSVVERLNEIVRGTDEFQAAESAGRLITIPTGDGITFV